MQQVRLNYMQVISYIRFQFIVYSYNKVVFNSVQNLFVFHSVEDFLLTQRSTVVSN